MKLSPGAEPQAALRHRRLAQWHGRALSYSWHSVSAPGMVDDNRVEMWIFSGQVRILVDALRSRLFSLLTLALLAKHTWLSTDLHISL